MTNFDKKVDYSIYEGKEVTWIFDNNDNFTVKALVTGCEYDIGLSIEVVDPDEKHRMLDEDFPLTDGRCSIICLAGPSSSEWKYMPYTEKGYEGIFNILIKQIESGLLISSEIPDNNDYNPFASMASCSFR